MTQSDLIGHKCRRKTTVLDEEIDEMLAHPFLRSESHKLSSQPIGYLQLAIGRATQRNIKFREIEFQKNNNFGVIEIFL